MSVQEIMQLQTIENEDRKMAVMLAIHCSPVLRGIKAANSITVNINESSNMSRLLAGTGISCRFLRTTGNKGILYLYREKAITNYLFSEEVWNFLKGYGYQNSNLVGMLDHLGNRLHQYSEGRISFPHELGVFLEYPLDDVKGFLINNGKNSYCSGYWKVYHNVSEALKTFRQYDAERDLVIGEIIEGKTIREIVFETGIR